MKEQEGLFLVLESMQNSLEKPQAFLIRYSSPLMHHSNLHIFSQDFNISKQKSPPKGTPLNNQLLLVNKFVIVILPNKQGFSSWRIQVWPSEDDGHTLGFNFPCALMVPGLRPIAAQQSYCSFPVRQFPKHSSQC